MIKGQAPFSGTEQSRYVDRRTMIMHLQRILVPFLSYAEIDAKLAAIETAGVLSNHCSDQPQRFDLLTDVNGCLFNDPAFFEDRETRALPLESALWKCSRLDPNTRMVRRYRIEQRIIVMASDLLDDGLIQLWVPAPRAIEGVQEVRLLEAEPAGLSEHYLKAAGQIYGASLLIEPGQRPPVLRLVFEVEQLRASPHFLPDEGPRPDATDETEAAGIRHWMSTLGVDLSSVATPSLVDLLVDRVERDFRFAPSPRTGQLIASLLSSRTGNVQAITKLLAGALSQLNIVNRFHTAQRLMLNGSRSTLYYPASTGYDHVFIEWYDPRNGNAGYVDLSYLERWSFAARPANTSSEAMRGQLQEIGERGRAWLRRNPYPVDLVFAGSVPRSRMCSASSHEAYELSAPVSVQLGATLQ